MCSSDAVPNNSLQNVNVIKLPATKRQVMRYWKELLDIQRTFLNVSAITFRIPCNVYIGVLPRITSLCTNKFKKLFPENGAYLADTYIQQFPKGLYHWVEERFFSPKCCKPCSISKNNTMQETIGLCVTTQCSIAGTGMQRIN